VRKFKTSKSLVAKRTRQKESFDAVPKKHELAKLTDELMRWNYNGNDEFIRLIVLNSENSSLKYFKASNK